MAKNSMRRALVIAIVTGALAVMLTVPGVLRAIQNSTNSEYDLTPLDPEASFYSSDPFSWTSVKYVEVSAPKLVHVYLVDDSTYQRSGGDIGALFTSRLNTDDYEINRTQNITLPAGVHAKFHLVLNNSLNPGTGATAVTSRTISPTISGMVGLLMISFVAANLAWVAYLMPIERKYSVSSIYK